MSISTRTRLPLALADATLTTKVALVAVGTLVLALSAWIKIPMIPVPMTMQTYVVLVIGALCGWRLAAATVAAYLAEGFIGLPVFTNWGAGPAYFFGPTGGYLIGFLAAAVLVGVLAERGGTRDMLRATFTLLLGHALIFCFGVAWLASAAGWSKAIAIGLAPFWLATVLKTALAVVTVRALDRSRL
jgi:biotin transport system substrate-specific component